MIEGGRSMSNKNAATEDEIGILHKLITLCHNKKAGSMLEAVKNMEDAGFEVEEILAVINSRDLASMQKWVEYNGVSCTTAIDDEESELSKRLKSLKLKQTGKIVDFKDVMDG
jgi:arsenate reductase-like glutaredoxin family protein